MVESENGDDEKIEALSEEIIKKLHYIEAV